MSKPEVGDEVRIRMGPYNDSKWVCVTVTEILSSQFCGNTKSGRIAYALFNAEGDAWKRGW